jgi:hypothetical protein
VLIILNLQHSPINDSLVADLVELSNTYDVGPQLGDVLHTDERPMLAIFATKENGPHPLNLHH